MQNGSFSSFLPPPSLPCSSKKERHSCIAGGEEGEERKGLSFPALEIVFAWQERDSIL